MRGRATMISCAVHDGREPEVAENPAAIYHPAAVPSPTVSQHNDTPGWSFRGDTPHFQRPSLFSGDRGVRYLPPVRLILNGISRELQNQIGHSQGDEKIEDAHGENEQKSGQGSLLHSGPGVETRIPLTQIS